MSGPLHPFGLRPDQNSLILPFDRLRTVWTWKPAHVERLAAHPRSEEPIYLALVREPDNTADPNAILVYDKIGALGYLHGSVSRWLARPLDRQAEPVIVEGRIWSGPTAYVGVGGRNTVLAFLRDGSSSE